MKIFNADNSENRSPDLRKGYLKEDKMFVKHHEAVEAVAEEGHWKVVAEYSNGGKDVEWVVDVPAVEAREAWDEYEDIHRYVEYTEEELASIKDDQLNKTVEDRLDKIEAQLNTIMQLLLRRK